MFNTIDRSYTDNQTIDIQHARIWHRAKIFTVQRYFVLINEKFGRWKDGTVMNISIRWYQYDFNMFSTTTKRYHFRDIAETLLFILSRTLIKIQTYDNGGYESEGVRGEGRGEGRGEKKYHTLKHIA